MGLFHGLKKGRGYGGRPSLGVWMHMTWKFTMQAIHPKDLLREISRTGWQRMLRLFNSCTKGCQSIFLDEANFFEVAIR